MLGRSAIVTEPSLGVARAGRLARVGLADVACSAMLGMRSGSRLLDGGRIVSPLGMMLALNAPSHALHDGAVASFMRALAAALDGCGVTVNALAPAPVGTGSSPEGKTDEAVSRRTGMAPRGRIGWPRSPRW